MSVTDQQQWVAIGCLIVLVLILSVLDLACRKATRELLDWLKKNR